MRKYIFCISTGRSGSNYLATMLDAFENIDAFHEPKPIMNGEMMVQFSKAKPELLNLSMPAKIQSIQSLSQEGKCYVETNHSFIKGFGWRLPSFIAPEEIGVIILRREKSKIIRSLYRIGCTPLSYVGYSWIMNPLMKNPERHLSWRDKLKYRGLFLFYTLLDSEYNYLGIKVKKPKWVTQFEEKLLDWYVEETEAQAQKFKRSFPQIKVFETHINQLNKVEEFKKMLDFFSIAFKPQASFFDKMGLKTNLKI